MTSGGPEDEDGSYIDYDTFLDPDFSATAFANTLVLSTNNPNDTPLDLSTPLSKVLFDIQEIDSHIDLLTTRSALPLLEHTKRQTDASTRIVDELDGQVRALNDSYRQLEREVIRKHAEADDMRLAASRLWETLRLGRAVGRCLQLGRQLEVQHAEATGSAAGSAGAGSKKEDHRALVRCANTLLSLRDIFDRRGPGEEGRGLEKVDVVRSLHVDVVTPVDRATREAAERIIRDFSVGSPAHGGAVTFAQAEEIKARAVSAALTLYLLSPTSASSGSKSSSERWAPQLLLQSLDAYLRAALTTSLAGLARSLATLPTLDRTLAELSARCQSIVALESLLESTKPPVHPLVPPERLASSAGGTKGGSGSNSGNNLLQPLLAHLETGSLVSYFWRTLAGGLGMRVQEIVSRGGVSARTLRSNRASVETAIKECVLRGCQVPASLVSGKARKGAAARQEAGRQVTFDREVAVMVGSVVGNLGR